MAIHRRIHAAFPVRAVSRVRTAVRVRAVLRGFGRKTRMWWPAPPTTTSVHTYLRPPGPTGQSCRAGLAGRAGRHRPTARSRQAAQPRQAAGKIAASGFSSWPGFGAVPSTR